MLGNFDARQVQPSQGLPQHPIGKFPAMITSATLKPNGSNGETGGHLEVMFKTPAGMIAKRYNLFYMGQNQEITVRIAQGELSALCHATGIFMPGDTGERLVNAQLQIEVSAQRKNAEYHEVSHVYDVNGNEPGKGGGAPQPQPAQQQPAPQFQPQQQPQPMPQQGQPGPGVWGSPQPGGGQPQPQPQPQPQMQPMPQQQPAPNWLPNPQPQQGQPQPAQQGQQANPWQQGGGQQAAPWGNR